MARYRGKDAARTPTRQCGPGELECIQCREPVTHDEDGNATCAVCGQRQYLRFDGGRGRWTTDRPLGHSVPPPPRVSGSGD